MTVEATTLKTLSTTATPTNEQQPDSNTLVHLRLHGERTTMTIRILPELKKQFTERTRQLGLSTCHVAEGLIQGWLVGLSEKVELVHQSPTINLSLTREVKRARRYAEDDAPDFEEDARRTVIWRDSESKIIMPELRPVLDSRSAVGKSVGFKPRELWSGKPVNLERALDNWGSLSLAERLNAAKFARCYPSNVGADPVLKWYAAYKLQMED